MTEKIKRTVRAFHSDIVDGVLKADLEKFRQKALDSGASEAKVIPADFVSVDERVRLKCAIPTCANYGRCGNCPPNVPELDFVRKAFQRYHWAILFKNDVPAEDFTIVGRYNPHGKKHHLETHEIAAQVELAAFEEGYPFALGLGRGGCRDALCGGDFCRKLDSGRCPHFFKARPSVEAMGIDVVELFNKVGWEIYPIHRNTTPDAVPCGVSVGLVFIH